MSIDLGAARRVFASYRETPLGTRAYVAGRIVVAPLGALGDELRPVRGRVLSLGSGLGVVERYLAEANPALEIEGVDLDADKVALVAATAERSPRVVLRRADATELVGEPTFDAVVICDLLHHLDPERQAAAAGVAAAHLRPGGVCVVKDLDVLPRWKHEWNRCHDRLVAGPEPIFCRAPDDMVEVFRPAGFAVERAERIERPWTPYAHYMLRLRRPT